MSMIRRRRRCLPIESDSSEDDFSNKRRLRSSTTSRKQHVSITNNRKKGGRLPIVTSEEEEDSSSEAVGYYADPPMGFIDDYDTGNSGVNASTLVYGLIETRSGRFTGKLDSAATDSSDSEVPIGFQRKKKRLKLCSTSNESSSEDEHREEHSRAVLLDNSARPENNHDGPNTSRNSDLSRTERNRSKRRLKKNTRIPTNNNKWRRIADDDSESESSSDDDIRPRVLRHHSRTVFYSNSSSSSDSEDEVPIRPTKRRAARTIIYSDDDNTSQQKNTDEDAEVCPICLNDFNLQEVGKPSTCDHCFCLGCIQEWAKNNNTCPVDRRLFSSIAVLSSINGAPVQEIPVISIQQMVTDWEAEEVEFTASDFEMITLDNYSSDDQDGIYEICQVCLRMSRNGDNSMIYCDACYAVYHLQCVDPPLQSYPVGPWICMSCEDTVE